MQLSILTYFHIIEHHAENCWRITKFFTGITTQMLHSRSFNLSSPRPTAHLTVLPVISLHHHPGRFKQVKWPGKLLITTQPTHCLCHTRCWDQVHQDWMRVDSHHLCPWALLHISLQLLLHCRGRLQAPDEHPEEPHCHTPHLQRILLHLQQYNATISYKPGNEMELPDALPRLSAKYEIPLDLHLDHIALSKTRLTQIHKKTESCLVLSNAFYRLIQNGWYATCRQTPWIAHKYWNMCDSNASDNGEASLYPY